MLTQLLLGWSNMAEDEQDAHTGLPCMQAYLRITTNMSNRLLME
jgi:hypothetical protein